MDDDLDISWTPPEEDWAFWPSEVGAYGFRTEADEYVMEGYYRSVAQSAEAAHNCCRIHFELVIRILTNDFVATQG